MHKTLIISRLFSWVLHNDMERYNVTSEDIKKGIEHMKKAYDHKALSLKSEIAEAANFKSAAYRCAYLHKFAILHTVLVAQTFERVIHINYNHFHDLVVNSGSINLCSLGGGPGSDIVGLLAPLHDIFGPFPVFTNVIDCLPHWNATFNSLIREVSNGMYSDLGSYFSAQMFKWNYIGANLLDAFSDEVKKAISSADIINMIKFISAAICVDTPSMIKRIFKLMKPGAIVFFIDNSVGEVKHIMSNTAKECKLQSLFGPIYHEHYINRLIEITRFGYSSCYSTKISIQVWIKPHNVHNLRTNLNYFGRNNKLPLNEIQSTPIIDRSKNHRILLVSPLSINPSFTLNFDTSFDEEKITSQSYGSEINGSPCINSLDENESLSICTESPNIKRKCLLSSPYTLDYSSNYSSVPESKDHNNLSSILDESKDWTDFSENFDVKENSLSFDTSASYSESSNINHPGSFQKDLNQSSFQHNNFESGNSFEFNNTINKDQCFRPKYADSGYISPQESYYDTTYSPSNIHPSLPINHSRWHYHSSYITNPHSRHSKSDFRGFQNYGSENSSDTHWNSPRFFRQDFRHSNRKVLLGNQHRPALLARPIIENRYQDLDYRMYDSTGGNYKASKHHFVNRNVNRFNPYRRMRF